MDLYQPSKEHLEQIYASAVQDMLVVLNRPCPRAAALYYPHVEKGLRAALNGMETKARAWAFATALVAYGVGYASSDTPLPAREGINGLHHIALVELITLNVIPRLDKLNNSVILYVKEVLQWCRKKRLPPSEARAVLTRTISDMLPLQNG